MRAATAEAYALFGAARQLAILRGRLTTLEVDTAAGRILVRSGGDTLRVRQLADIHGVRLTATRLSTTYAPSGLGHGVSNMTFIVHRGYAAETLVVSRLGRVRR